MEGSGPKRDLLSFYRELCLERGASLSVGPAHYRWFVELTDDEMKEIVRLILHDRAKDIKRWTDAFPQMKSEQDIFDYIELALSMIAKGFVAVQKDGSLGCVAPIGEVPSDAELNEIDHKILASRHLFSGLVFQRFGIGEGIDRKPAE